MIIQRDIKTFLLYCAEKFPVITITGPRQAGKTTLAKTLFSDKKYISLEDLDTREVATKDPRGFLSSLGPNVILDEAQNCPELFSYIQTIVDERKQNGQFILTGSQNFLMLEKVSQSLAGRTAIINLLPFSYNEIATKYSDEASEAYQLIYNGGYPAIYDRKLEPAVWYQSYISTYIERDVRKIINVQDLSRFQTFLRLCAGRIGQLINLSSLATECGTNYNTIKSWLSVLEASYVIYMHRPHFKNFNKRLVKQHKLYFYDTGVACNLLGIQNKNQIFSHYMGGALFENFVIIEMMKNKFNAGKSHNLYFWRDNHGHELDVLMDEGGSLLPIEIKSSQTFNAGMLSGLKYWQQLAKTKDGYLVYQGNKNFTFENFNILEWKAIKLLCDR